MKQSKIIADILEERDRQTKLYDPSFDKKNTINDWITYCTNYLGRASHIEPRKNFIKVAALCLGVIEHLDNNEIGKRHYD